MTALNDALNKSRAVSNRAHDTALQLKASGQLSSIVSGGQNYGISQWQNNAKYRERFAMFRGWLYSAVNAIGMAAQKQPVCVGKVKGSEKKKQSMTLVKSKMTTSARSKASDRELEVLEDSTILGVLENPNPMQNRGQFTYMFVANLALTGWGYVVRDKNPGGDPEFYCLPTTWIKPDHTKGPFAEFIVENPRKPGDKEILTREDVGFAHLPNPSDPLSALAPAASQMQAIRIDDHIQTSREQYFENGIFPSVVVAMGREPHDEVAGGLRPRLSGPQRRQVYGAIKKAMGDVTNYGAPAILDGVIESITPLSMKGNEMGWKESAAEVKTMILSAYGVHPFILSEPMNVGGYSQAAIIWEMFYEKVNAYLDMLGNVMTNLIANNNEDESDLLVWWEEASASDPTREDAQWREARKNNDISQNEYRARMGLPPDEDRNESIISPQTAPHILGAMARVGEGSMTEEQAVAFFVSLGIPDDQAKSMAKGPEKLPEPVPEQPPVNDELAEEVKGLMDELKRPLEVETRSMELLIDRLFDEAAGKRLI